MGIDLIHMCPTQMWLKPYCKLGLCCAEEGYSLFFVSNVIQLKFSCRHVCGAASIEVPQKSRADRKMPTTR